MPSTPALPHGVNHDAIWQRSQTGTVAGIAGAVMRGLSNGNIQALAQLGRPAS